METAYVVTTKRGGQFMCPTRGAAGRTYEARGGVSITTTLVRVAEYRWRAQDGDSWGKWPGYEHLTLNMRGSG